MQIFVEINFLYYSPSFSWFTSSLINIWHLNFHIVINFSLQKFLSGKPLIFNACVSKLLCKVFSFLSNLAITLDRYWWRTGLFCYHFCRWEIFCTCFFLDVNKYWPFISALSTKLLLVHFGDANWTSSAGSSVRLFCSSPCFPETTSSNSPSVNMPSIASSKGFDQSDFLWLTEHCFIWQALDAYVINSIFHYLDKS